MYGVEGGEVLIKGETDQFRMCKPLTPQKVNGGGDIRLLVWACSGMPPDWKLNLHLRLCTFNMCTCPPLFLLCS